MIVRSGRITANDGELIGIRVELPSSCAACGNGRGCGALAFAKLLSSSDHAVVGVPRPPRQRCRIGDKVLVSISETRLLKLSVIAYLLPVASLIFGAWIGEIIAPPAGADLWSAIGAGSGLAVAVAILRLFERAGRYNDGTCQVRVSGQAGLVGNPYP